MPRSTTRSIAACWLLGASLGCRSAGTAEPPPSARAEADQACLGCHPSAVAVLSGKLRGQTVTMPLQVELFYNEYAAVAAFSLASVLAGLALVTLIIKSWLEWRFADQLAATGRRH